MRVNARIGTSQDWSASITWVLWDVTTAHINCSVLTLLPLKLSGLAALALHNKGPPGCRLMRIVCATDDAGLVATLNTSLWESITWSSRDCGFSGVV